MDYDLTDIPDGYDRGRDHGPEVLDLWMKVVASCAGEQRINTILDLGCGTGRFSESLAAHFHAEVVGKVAAGADSVLAQLSPSDFQAGMNALRGHAARVRDTAVIEPIDVFVFRS